MKNKLIEYKYIFIPILMLVVGWVNYTYNPFYTIPTTAIILALVPSVFIYLVFSNILEYLYK